MRSAHNLIHLPSSYRESVSASEVSRILSGVQFAVAQGERRVILGPNGAGKTTLFNVVCGDYSPDAGSIRYFGSDITHLKQHMRARAGIARTYQKLASV